MNPSSPRICSEPLPKAFAIAQETKEPVFAPSSMYADDRGWSLMNEFRGVLSPQGQVNFSVTYPGVVKAWHRHDLQTDFWIGLIGHLKAGVFRESDGKSWVATLGEKRPGVLIIPPPLWHGVATIGDTSAGLLYYVTHAYDPAHPDELRRPHDSVPGFPWQVRHG